MPAWKLKVGYLDLFLFFFQEAITGKTCFSEGLYFFLQWGEESLSVGLAVHFAFNISLVGGYRLLTSLRKRKSTSKW
jgi:hypothetical protein